MARRYSRREFLDRLRAEVTRGRPLVMAGAGSGICAKFIERGGVDILGVYNTGYFRMHGYGSLAGMLPIADSNELVYQMARREVLPQVRQTPVVLGVNGVDPLRDLRIYLEDCRRLGISGVHNFPTVAWFDGEFRRTLEATGLGYQHEIDMLNVARELDLLTVGYAFNAEDTERLMLGASPDIFIFHCGITGGGSTGPALAGHAFANGIYLQGNTALTFSPTGTETVWGVIGDDKGSASAAGYVNLSGYTEGSIGIAVNGTGTLQLEAANTYTGSTTIYSGTLELAAGASAGAGAIVFDGPAATLQIDAPSPACKASPTRWPAWRPATGSICGV